MVKKLKNMLKNDKQQYLFIPLGIVFILFANRITSYAPYIAGAVLILYAAINVFTAIRYPESGINLGDAVIRGIVGIILLLETKQAIAILGIVWAVISLNDAAKEINDYFRTKKFRIIGAVGIVFTIIISALLMLDPFEHFSFHVRILGIEMIAETLIRRRE